MADVRAAVSTAAATRCLLAVATCAAESRDRTLLGAEACARLAEALEVPWAAIAHADADGRWVPTIATGGVPGLVPPSASVRTAMIDPARPEAGMLAVPATAPTDWPDGESEALLADLAALLARAFERLRLDAEIAQNEQRLAEAQELAGLGSYDWHIPTDTNTWSDQLYRIYGYEPGAFNASYERFLSMIHPDDRERIVAIHTQAMQDFLPYRMEERIVRPDGEIRILDSTGKVVLDEQGHPVRMVGICLDVTDQRRAAEALRISQDQAAQATQRLAQADERRRQALEINDNVVQGLTTVLGSLEMGWTDEALHAASATLASASAMMSELLADGREELVPGDLVRNSTAPAPLLDRPGAALALRPPPQAGDGDAGEARVLTVLLADDSADLRGLYRLMLSREGIEVVAEAANGIDAVRLALERRPDIAVLDLAMPGMDGLQVTAALKRDLPDCKIVMLSGFEEARVGEQARAAGVDYYLSKGVDADTLTEVLFAVGPPGVHRRPAAGAVGTLAPDPVEELLHELRTPITVIAGVVATMVARMDHLEREQMRELLDTVARNAGHVGGLIETYGDLRRIDTDRLVALPEPVDVAALVREGIADLREVLSGHELVVDADAAPAVVDPMRIRQVLTNLLSNAAKFSPPGTVIGVRVTSADDAVTIAVTDHGPGIAPADRPRLFRPFERLGAGGKGLGIGLYLSRAIAEAHGGTLELAETPPGTTTFVLRVPANRGSAAAG